MKKGLLLIFMITGIVSGKSQDTIILSNSSKIISLVLLIEKDSIRYKPITDISGPDLYINTLDVQLVKYKNGTVVNIESLYGNTHNAVPLQTITCNIQGTPKEMYNTGKADAEIYYPNKHPEALTLGLATLVLGPVGAIPGLVVAFTTPYEENLNYPCPELWKNNDYRKGYKKKARKMKRRLIGSTISVCLLVSAIMWTAILSK